MERKLAAILYADVAGYSRLVDADEEGTHRALKAKLSALSDGVGANGGRVCHIAGDAVLADFPSVTAALRTAIDVQSAFRDAGTDTPNDHRLQFRIGVNLGEVIIDGDEIYGNGVNVAARLETLAVPGGICISARVLEQVEDKFDLDLEDLGLQTVKNIERPVHAYLVQVGAPAPTGAAATMSAGALLTKPSIAVLPFTNLSSDPEQAFFADGLTEDIITMLAAWRAFPVIARNSTFIYKNRVVDPKHVARDLGARYIVEGSVRRGGRKIRVGVQLIDALLGHQLWGDRYDRDLDDLFVVQEEIAIGIAATVAPELERVELRRASNKPTDNISAWDLCVRGNAALNAYTPAGNAEARQLFEQAIELDDGYSDAHAGLAFSFLRDLLLEVADSRNEWVARAFDAARRAVALDESSSLAHLALGTAHIWANEHDLSIEETRIAVEINPSNFHACLALGNRLDLAGCSEEGRTLLEQSLRLNPRDPRTHLYYCYMARALAHARRYDDALLWSRRAVSAKSGFPQSHFLVGVCLSHLGRCDAAREAVAECERISPGFVQTRANWNAYRNPEANRHLLAGLRRCGILPAAEEGG